MNYTSSELQTVLFPKRIVKTVGCVTDADVLLTERAPIVSLSETMTAKLSKTGEENPYIVLDFGYETHGSARLVVERISNGKKQVKMRLSFGESVSEALSHLGDKGACNDHSARDFEVTVPLLSNVDYGCTGFRFLCVELLEECTVKFRSIVAVSKTANVEKKGYIRTDDEYFNKVLDTAIYTCYLNMQQGVIWDGIKRDRLVWAGDLNSEILTLGYFYGPVEHIRNSLDFLRDGTPEHGWMNNIPSYSVWWVLGHLNHYLFSGDGEYLSQNMDRINSIMKDVDICVNAEGGADFERIGVRAHMPYYLDWPTRDTADAEVGTMLLIYMVSKCAIEMKLEGFDVEIAESLMKKTARYLTSPCLMKQTLALQALCGGGDASVLARLEEGGAKGFSTFMSYFLFKGLSLAGSQSAKKIANEYYGGMLSRGATTFWEDFDIDWLEGSGRIDEEPREGELDLHADFGKYCYLGRRHSFCHGWACGVVAWAVEDLLGLKILEPGYRKVSISPNLSELRSIDAQIPTPHGMISISSKRGEAPVISLPDGVELV